MDDDSDELNYSALAALEEHLTRTAPSAPVLHREFRWLEGDQKRGKRAHIVTERMPALKR